MTYNDITYCSRECANMECKRNQKHLPKDWEIVSMAGFADCENWKDVSADMMFEKLGYEKTWIEGQTTYTHDEVIMCERFQHEITFIDISKTVFLHGKSGWYANELKAINKKCQELGWE